MQPRRPDSHTRAQRLAERGPEAILRMIRELSRGSASSDIRDVYRAEVERGTGCRVLMP